MPLLLSEIVDLCVGVTLSRAIWKNGSQATSTHYPHVLWYQAAHFKFCSFSFGGVWLIGIYNSE